MSRVYAYLRVSTDEQADSGAGIGAQRRAISLDCERRGWMVTEWVEDLGWSGASLDRPGIAALLPTLRRGDVLMVSKLDRLSRSLVDAAGLLATAQRRGWLLIALDLGLDLATPNGRLIAGVLASVAEWERATIAGRTKDAMAAKKAAGGIRYGHRSKCPPDVMDRIEAHRDDGWSLGQIARALTADRVPTPTGRSTWYTSSVRSILSARANDRQAGLVTD